MLNQTITIVGNAGSKLDVNELPSGNIVARFPLEVRQFGSVHPMIFYVEAWNERAQEVIDAYRKGLRVSISGKFKLEQFTRQHDNGSLTTALKPILTMSELLVSGNQPKQKAQTDSKNKTKVA